MNVFEKQGMYALIEKHVKVRGFVIASVKIKSEGVKFTLGECL